MGYYNSFSVLAFTGFALVLSSYGSAYCPELLQVQQVVSQSSTQLKTTDLNTSATSVEEEAIYTRPKSEKPAKFENQQKALKHGCKLQHLKGKIQESCVIQTYTISHDFILDIYDRSNRGEFIRTDSLILRSHYIGGEIQYKDLLGDGKKSILAPLKTGGTGIELTIVVIIVFNKRQFQLVAAEPLTYGNSAGGWDLIKFTANYKIRNEGTQNVSLVFTPEYMYISQHPRKPKRITKVFWDDELKWNQEKFSFYDRQLEEYKAERSIFFMQKNISRIRATISEQNLTDFDRDSWIKTKVGEVTAEQN
ncbi:MAG: hypothetical protein KME45_25065 [Stenomitos rutilans HA7619-LM2]|jgi:hypothetical protein|nr:hypothetical protein [Stenomitos rutilans HA7619-LM2]